MVLLSTVGVGWGASLGGCAGPPRSSVRRKADTSWRSHGQRHHYCAHQHARGWAEDAVAQGPPPRHAGDGPVGHRRIVCCRCDARANPSDWQGRARPLVPGTAEATGWRRSHGGSGCTADQVEISRRPPRHRHQGGGGRKRASPQRGRASSAPRGPRAAGPCANSVCLVMTVVPSSASALPRGGGVSAPAWRWGKGCDGVDGFGGRQGGGGHKYDKVTPTASARPHTRGSLATEWVTTQLRATSSAATSQATGVHIQPRGRQFAGGGGAHAADAEEQEERDEPGKCAGCAGNGPRRAATRAPDKWATATEVSVVAAAITPPRQGSPRPMLPTVLQTFRRFRCMRWQRLRSAPGPRPAAAVGRARVPLP